MSRRTIKADQQSANANGASHSDMTDVRHDTIALDDTDRADRDLFEAVLRAELDPHVIMRAARDDGGAIIDFEIVEANDAAVAYYRTTRESLIGSRMVETLPGLRGSDLLERYVTCARTGDPLVLRNYRHPSQVTLDDRYFDVQAVKVGDALSNTWRDVTESMLATERIRLLAENATDIVFRTNASFEIEWVSSSVQRVLGWNPQLLRGASIVDLVHEDEVAWLLDVVAVMVPGERRVEECRVRDGRGGFRWVAISAVKFVDENGELANLIGGIRDVEVERANRLALIESEARYRLLAENSSDVVMVSNDIGEVMWISDSVTSLVGWRPEDLLGTLSTQYIHRDDLRHVEAARTRLAGGGEIPAFHCRMRTKNGDYRWLAVVAKTVDSDDGRVRITSWRDAQREVEDRQALIESEQQFRLLAENSSDVVYQTDRDGTIQWISPSVVEVLGWSADELVGKPSAVLLYNDDVAAMRLKRHSLLGGMTVPAHETRFKTADGDFLWMTVRPHPLNDTTGAVVGAVLSLQNSHAEVLTRRAMNTMFAGSRGMVTASDEQKLLDEMCRTAVGEGGYAFSWYGRRVDDERHSVAVVASSHTHQRYQDNMDVTWDNDSVEEGPMGHALRYKISARIRDLGVGHDTAPWRAAAYREGFRSVISVPVLVDGVIDGALAVYAVEPHAFDDFATAVLEDLASEMGFGLGRLRHDVQLAQSLADKTFLTSAIDQADDAIVVTDPNSTIIYANPATARVSGYEISELIGANPRVLQSGLQSREFYEDMWQVLLSGQSWNGLLVNRRKNGELFEEDATISPIRDDNDTLIAYVAVKHDMTSQRQLESVEADLVRERGDRASLVEIMREIQPGESIHATSQVFCDAVVRLTSSDAACVLLLNDAGELIPIAISGSRAFDVSVDVPLTSDGVDQFERLKFEPIAFDFDPRQWPGNTAHGSIARDEGLIRAVFLPIRWEDQLVGALMLATKEPDVAVTLRSRFSYFEELGSYAGTLFGAQARSFQHRSTIRSQLRDVIDHHKFHPVFQPFVDLTDGSVVAYEALTRFDDGCRPDLRFIEAHSVGMGSDLESACVKSALDASRHLPTEIFVAFNFAPSTILDGSAARLLHGVNRPTVVEVTEHARIDDYKAVRDTVGAIANCRLAVDDAGAGFSSLTHILELRPEIVKVDLFIVRDIDKSPARQAMVAGLCHFAAQSGTIIVAEGIETAAEADVLRHLGSTLGRGGMLGQGYFFARPAPFA